MKEKADDEGDDDNDKGGDDDNDRKDHIEIVAAKRKRFEEAFHEEWLSDCDATVKKMKTVLSDMTSREKGMKVGDESVITSIVEDCWSEMIRKVLSTIVIEVDDDESTNASGTPADNCSIVDSSASTVIPTH